MKFPVIVIGGGHAGVEAAAASCRLGLKTALITLKAGKIAQMSCNPAIGGLGKGQLVKEVDALGGLMGKAIDQSGVQFRVLNSSRGPAVQSSRAQADRDLYKAAIQGLLAGYDNLTIIEAEAEELLTNPQGISGVKLGDGRIIESCSVVLTSGTFLKGLMHTGSQQTAGGRHDDVSANSLSESLKNLGFTLGRMKTGTPPRLRLSTINFEGLTEQPGDEDPQGFSFSRPKPEQKQISCWLTTTNAKAHQIVRDHKDESPMFNGQIKSGGPRYCPSIEDKVFRFADKEQHNIFLEPEGYESDVVYPNGISTSLPVEVQEKFIRTIAGLENVEIIVPGYAVEYDMHNPVDLKPTLETKRIAGLFFAGQINGTSGYEEAAGQGLVAGVNAAHHYLGKQDFILSRAEAYIGVMIDDLVTKGIDEPYRMFTSRAEYRLLLREDNVVFRLCPIARDLGLLSPVELEAFSGLLAEFIELKQKVESFFVSPVKHAEALQGIINIADFKDGVKLSDLVRRPELNLRELTKVLSLGDNYSDVILRAVETGFKFAGYIARQEQEVTELKKLDHQRIPEKFDFDSVHGLREEFKQKLNQHRPYSFGQVKRIPGLTPSAISLLAVELKKRAALG